MNCDRLVEFEGGSLWYMLGDSPGRLWSGHERNGNLFGRRVSVYRRSCHDYEYMDRLRNVFPDFTLLLFHFFISIRDTIRVLVR